MNIGKSVLIAGGTGFVGRALVLHLLAKGYEIKLLTRNVQKARKIFPDLVTIYKWPDGNEKVLLSNSKSCEAVINLSGENIGARRWTKKNKTAILNSRIQSVLKLADIITLMPQKPKVFVQASAVGYYGYNSSMPWDESSPKGSGFLAEVVQKWEEAFAGINLSTTRKVILRLGIVMSEQGGFLKKMKKLFNMGLAVCPGSGKQKLSWIHIDDLVEVICKAIENTDYKEVLNVVSPHPVSLWEFTTLLKNDTKAVAKIRIPSFVFRLFLGSEKANEMVLANQVVTPKKLLEHQFNYSYSSLNQIFSRSVFDTP